MNKIFKTFLAASVSLLAVACNLDQVNDVYTAEGNEPSMLQTVFNETELDATLETIAIPVVRSNSSEAATVNLTATLPAGITVSGTAVETLENGNVVYSTSVSFAAGEAQTGCVLNISEMAVGSSYKGTVAIAEGEKVNEHKVTMSTAFTLAKAYTWVSLGQGEWFDQLSLMSDSSYGVQTVEVMKADGFERYRIMNPYANTDQLAAAWGASSLGGNKSSFIEFWVLDNGVNVAWDGWWFPGILYDGDGTDIKAYLPSALDASLAEEDVKSLFVEEKVVEFHPYWYIDGLGGFGTKYPCFLTLPGGPSMSEVLGI